MAKSLADSLRQGRKLQNRLSNTIDSLFDLEGDEDSPSHRRAQQLMYRAARVDHTMAKLYAKVDEIERAHAAFGYR